MPFTAGGISGSPVILPLSLVKPNGYNPNRQPAHVFASLKHGLKTDGWLANMALLVWGSDEHGAEKMMIIDGEHRWRAAPEVGIREAPMVILRGVSEAKAKALTVAMNNRRGEFEKVGLEALIRSIGGGVDAGDLALDLAMPADDVSAILATVNAPPLPDLPEPPRPPPPPLASASTEDEEEGPTKAARLQALRESAAKKWGTKPGQLWRVTFNGVEARLFVGDCTDPIVRERLAEFVDIVLSDPPYCSGGWQEAGRHAGSIGTRQKDDAGKRAHIPTVANDNLSTRGFLALIEAALRNVDARAVYLFHDWRMWVYLYDLSERLGYRVRNQLIWDKGAPGLGIGWRSASESILVGVKESTGLFDNLHSAGNVLTCPRTRNEWHATEKPVPLLERILSVTPTIRSVFDPFTGSGSTLLACMKRGLAFRGCELDPGYAGVALTRAAEAGAVCEVAP